MQRCFRVIAFATLVASVTGAVRAQESRDLRRDALALFARQAELGGPELAAGGTTSPGDPPGIQAIRLIRQFADASELAARPDLAAAALKEGSDAAAKLEWRVAAARLLIESADLAKTFGPLEPAVASYRKALEIAQAAGDGGTLARVRLALGLVDESMERHPAASSYYEQALADAEGVEDRPIAVRALVALTRIAGYTSQLDRGLELGNRALAISEEIGDAAGSGLSSQALGWIHLRRGAPDEGVRLLRSACEKLDASGPKRDAASCRRDLALMLSALARETEAREEALLALRAFEAVGHRLGAASSRVDLGHTRCVLGEFAAGIGDQEAGVEELLALGRQTFAAGRMARLALSYLRLGRVGDASRLFTRARDSGSPVVAARARSMLALALLESGRLREALIEAEAALLEIERSDPITLGSALLTLGSVEQSLGHPERARPRFARALEAYSAQGFGYGIETARSSLAGVDYMQGRPDEAIAAQQEYLSRCRESGSPMQLQIALLGLSRMLVDRDRLDEADAALREFQEMSGKLGTETDGAEADTLLARVHANRNQPAEAIALASRALAIQQARGDVSKLGETHLVIARSQRALGRADLGIEAARAAVQAEDSISAPLGETDAIPIRGVSRTAADEGLRCAAELARLGAESRPADVFEKALWFVEESRSRVLAQALASRHAPISTRLSLETLSAHEGARRRLDEAQRKSGALRAGSDPADLRAAATALAAAKEEWQQSIARVHREAPRVADLAYPAPIGLEALKRLLPRGTAFVAYQATPDRLFALFIDAEGEEIFDLGATNDAISKAQAWLRFLASPQSHEAALAAALYDVLLRPLEKLLERNKRLVFCPDRHLNLVPFEALLRREGDAEVRVLEWYETAVVPSATVLGMLAADPMASAAGEGILALGDPVYPGETAAAAAPLRESRPAATAEAFARLADSGDEARAVAALFPEKQRLLLVRELATRDRLLASLRAAPRRFRAVHLACHGVVDATHPRLSGIVLGDGLVLGIDDLLALEVPADLVVLSACQTVGKVIEHGEGMMGLARGFFAAGCPRVIVSNWQVSDVATRELMVDFHRRMFEKHATAGSALREAKLERLRAGGAAAHPNRWAAFVLWGLIE